MNTSRHPQRTSPGLTPNEAHTLAVFAHELREPLGSILFAARALHDGPADGAAHREMSDLIERQGRYLGRLIEGALEGNRRAGNRPVAPVGHGLVRGCGYPADSAMLDA